MKSMLRDGTWALAALLGLVAIGCKPGGVGDPCIPEDEYQNTFSGFEASEVNVESRSFQCETRVCLVNHFRGRVSCPLGQTEEQAGTQPRCAIPGNEAAAPGDDAQNPLPVNITVPVQPQLVARQADDAVYCSCRCDGPDSNANYCECPDGFTCEPLVDELPNVSGGQLAGSYCIKNGTEYNRGTAIRGGDCTATTCGEN